MSGKETPDKKEEPATQKIDPLTVVVKELEEQRKLVTAIGAALLELSEKVKAAESRQGGGGGGVPSDFVKLLEGIFGKSESSNPFDTLAKHAEGMARAADALEHYRKPVLPYSPADRFLMRAGAMAVRRSIVYEGVKKKSESSEGMSDKEIDQALGFEEEEGEETEHVK